MFKRTKVCTGVLLVLGGAVAVPVMPVYAQGQTVEITGSRIKRADAEGSLPITTFTRAELQASGAATVAEFIRSVSFSTDGQFRPQSGSSAQGFSGVSLRGLGSNRTLVLVDGRRVAKSPAEGQSADVNSIPFAAVDRIEILKDGASAIYGSDAIGGVVNIILRKDFDGVALMTEVTKPSVVGGDREAASAIVGMSNDKGRIIAGMSRTTRDIIFVRDYPWGAPVGASTFSNNFFDAVEVEPGVFVRGTFRGIAGTCDFPDRGFYVSGNRCRYNFSLVASDEAETSTVSVFTRGEYRIAPDWTAYVIASSTRNRSFGRYAPVPDDILVQPDSPNNLVGSTTPLLLGHRFAAGGNRDTSTDGYTNDYNLGFTGSIRGLDVDFGLRRTTNKINELGRGFVVKAIATEFINSGEYNIADPFANSSDILNSFTTTTSRESAYSTSEIYANAQTDLFKLGGGTARLYVGAETRKEQYQDLYDSLSEAGQVLGSSGNSSAGARDMWAATTEVLLPISKSLELTLAARYEKYSDYGSDFSPKASLRFQPMTGLILRASAGKGFRAPTLDILSSKPAFSADSVIDLRNCLADGSFAELPEDEELAACAEEPFQINGLRIANPTLKSEKSRQFSFGASWDVTPNLNVTADYWNIEIKDTIAFISAQTIVNRDNGDDPLPVPSGLSITRDPITGAIQRIVSGFANEGTINVAGIDVDVIFGHKWSFGSFRHKLTYSQRTTAEINDVNFNGTWGSPKYRATLDNRWSQGPFDASWKINVIPKHGGDGQPFNGGYVTHDLQASYAAPAPLRGLKVTVGAVNAGEKFPTLNGSPYDQKPFNYFLYDAYGRQVYLRAEMEW
jgi:iron complex outermembrane receptor protein